MHSIFLHKCSILTLSLLLLLQSFGEVAEAKNRPQILSCETLLNSPEIDLELVLQKRMKQLQITGDTVLSEERLQASWEISRLGLSQIRSLMYDKDSFIYFLATALLASQNIMVNGGGGGGKTAFMGELFRAQMRAVNRSNRPEFQEYLLSTSKLYQELVALIQKDAKEKDPERRLFTLQLHQMVGDSKILGGVNITKYLGQGKWEIDYRTALLHETNLIAILDEVDRVNPGLHMSLLSLMNERKALAGNQIIDSMLETISSTTNASQRAFLNQAASYEIGSRMSYLDRSAVKAYVVDVRSSGNELYLLIQTAEAAEKNANENRFIIVDIRALRPLLKQVQTPQQVLAAMSDISLEIDKKNTEKLREQQLAQEKDPRKKPDFYPAFSGSTRSQGLVIPIWRSAFLIQQLMEGVPFSQRRMEMQPYDLVRLAPALLHGGPDSLVPQATRRVLFMQAQSRDKNYGIILGGTRSDINNDGKFDETLNNANLSTGFYDHHTQTFSYVSARTGEVRRLKFNPATKKLYIMDSKVADEINFSEAEINSLGLDENLRRYANIGEVLAKAHRIDSAIPGSSSRHVEHESSGQIAATVANGALLTSEKVELETIASFQDIFLKLVNAKVESLSGTNLTPVPDGKIRQQITKFRLRAQQLRRKIADAVEKKSQSVEDLAAQSVRNAYEEFSYFFLETGENVKSIFRSILNQGVILISGGQGSGKTMIALSALRAELAMISEAQVAKFNQVLAEGLIENKVVTGSLWVKQLHPMSTEGEIVGRLDYDKIRRGEGYQNNRKGSMSAKDVFFSLIDEVDKAPPGVRESMYSLLNERKVMDGHEVINSNLISIFLSANTTRSEFIQSQGPLYGSLPLLDRIQEKTSMLNKLSAEKLAEFHRRVYLGIKIEILSPLMLFAIRPLKELYQFDDAKRMMANIFFRFTKNRTDRLNATYDLHEIDPKTTPDFDVPSRGKSDRSAKSVLTKEFRGSVLLKRILAGANPSELRQPDKFKFELEDLEAFAELFLTSNPIYKVVHKYTPAGAIYFTVEDSGFDQLKTRLDRRTENEYALYKAEAEELTKIINEEVRAYLQSMSRRMARFPDLYSSAFISKEARHAALRAAGVSEAQIAEGEKSSR